MKYKKRETSVVRNGVYEHYRGNKYIVVDIAKDTDKDGDEFCVIYRALYDQGQLYSTTIERSTAMKDENTPRFRLLEIKEKGRNPNHVYPTMTM